MTLDDFPIQVTIPVLWGDQDLFGHVNNVVYVRWFESARVAYWDYRMRKAMELSDLGPILANITCNYKLQIRYPDTVHVGARITHIRKTSLTMQHAIFSEQSQAIAADGHSIVVMFNYKTQKPSRINDELRAAIEATEGKPID